MSRATTREVNRTDRLYALVEELRASSPRPLSVTRLAARFEVSTRTMERDISALQQTGVPIYAEPGRTGGYALDKRHTLPPVNFTPQEAAALAVALAKDPATPFSGATRSALHKVLAAMPTGEAERTKEVVERVKLLRRPAEEPTVPRLIQDAIVARHALRLRYADKDGIVSERIVEPVAFVNGPNHWYLTAWCRLRGAGRAFRLDRIIDARDTGEPVTPRRFEDVVKDVHDFEIRTPEIAI